jgi:hypothetical protein
MAMTNAEKQAAWRERQRGRMLELERRLAAAERKLGKSQRRKVVPRSNQR